MKKKNIINLIKYYSEENDAGFRNEAYEIARDFDESGDYQLAEYIQPLDKDEYQKFLGATGDELEKFTIRDKKNCIKISKAFNGVKLSIFKSIIKISSLVNNKFNNNEKNFYRCTCTTSISVLCS